MSKWNIAAKPKEEQDKVNVDLAASGVAYKERMNMPVVAEMVVEQPEHLREYFMERVHYREQSIQLPRIRSALHRDGGTERQKIAISSYMLILLLSP
jgi:DNA polymerase-3 subunit theta